MPTVIIENLTETKRDMIINKLREMNIEARPFFYPLSSLPFIQQGNTNTNSYSIYKSGIHLPSAFNMQVEDALYVIDKFKGALDHEV